MGWYIETPKEFVTSKAGYLATRYRAISFKPTATREDHLRIINDDTQVLLCVLQNPSWDAVRIVPDEQDYDYITMERPDDLRPRTFMIIDRQVAKQLCPSAPI